MVFTGSRINSKKQNKFKNLRGVLTRKIDPEWFEKELKTLRKKWKNDYVK